jgi:hypothetical protein
VTVRLPRRRLQPQDLANVTVADVEDIKSSIQYDLHPDFARVAWAEAAVPERYLNPEGLPAVTLVEMTSPDVPQPVLDAATQFVRTVVDNGEGGLLLTGPMGHGKSQVAAACLFEIVLCTEEAWWPKPRSGWTGGNREPDGPPPALWVEPANYLNEQRQTFNSDLLSTAQLRERQRVRVALESKRKGSAPGVLAVDDLGRSQRADGTEWEREQIEIMLRTRYDVNLPVIVTTNHALVELGARYNVADILREMCDVVGYSRPAGSRRAAEGLRRRAATTESQPGGGRVAKAKEAQERTREARQRHTLAAAYGNRSRVGES